MSRQNPWMKTSVGSGSSIRPTYMSMPSWVGMIRDSSYGSSPNGSPTSGSSASGVRRRRIRTRSAVTPSATPLATAPTTVPRDPARRRKRPLSLSTVVPSGDPDGAHPRHDLVVDGADRRGPVVGGGFAVVARPEEHRDVTGRHRVVAAVQHDLVHADPAGDGPPASGKPHRAGVGAWRGTPSPYPNGTTASVVAA